MNYRDLILEAYLQDDELEDEMLDSYDEELDEQDYEDDEVDYTDDDSEYDDAYLEGYKYAMMEMFGLDENALEDAIAKGLAERDPATGKVRLKRANQHGASKKTKDAVKQMTSDIKQSSAQKTAGVIARKKEADALAARAREDGRLSGYAQGKALGYKQGEGAGYTKGHSTGYKKGEAAGYKKGEAAGTAAGTAAGLKAGTKKGRIQGAAAAGALAVGAAGTTAAVKLAKDKKAWKAYKAKGGDLGFTEWLKSGKPAPSISQKAAASIRNTAGEIKSRVMKEALNRVYEEAYEEAFNEAYEEAFLEAYYSI